MGYHPNKSKFRKWLDQKSKILKVWFDILIPLIFLIENHPLLQFWVKKWQNHLHLILSPSEGIRNFVYHWNFVYQIYWNSVYQIASFRGVQKYRLPLKFRIPEGAEKSSTTEISSTQNYWNFVYQKFHSFGKIRLGLDRLAWFRIRLAWFGLGWP